MHYFIFTNKDAWISSGSNKITGESLMDQNYGQDEILELNKNPNATTSDYSPINQDNFGICCSVAA